MTAAEPLIGHKQTRINIEQNVPKQKTKGKP